ncbi:unnamed protein product [Miscanthus lutarioriparius]|uniref:Uncharacterized protein n=1 Tax=Miscanthus lutarioriparius TaxID=422564 RepID=A0A811NYS7_9POAL|nr:unnamed protein product [Miscanthus lutarioriparius]
MQELTPRERRVTEVRLFVWLAMADVDAYIAMTEDEVEEEYRMAGKLHRSKTPTTSGRSVSLGSPGSGRRLSASSLIDEYLKLLDDDDDDDDMDEEEGKELIGQPDTEKN